MPNLALRVLVVEAGPEGLEHGLAGKVLTGDQFKATTLTMFLPLQDGVHVRVKVTDVILHLPPGVLQLSHVCFAVNIHTNIVTLIYMAISPMSSKTARHGDCEKTKRVLQWSMEVLREYVRVGAEFPEVLVIRKVGT